MKKEQNKYIFMISSILLFIVGLFGIIKSEKVSKQNLELLNTIENQNKLIKILEVSCECDE